MSLTHTRLGAFWMNAVLIDYYILFQDCFFGYTGALVDIFGNTIDFMRRYTPDTDMNAIITFKNIGYFICAESFLGFSINM